LLLAGHPVTTWLLKIAVIAASIAAPSCSWSRCIGGCDSFVSVTAHVATSPSDLSGATVMLCWNSKCSSGTIGAVAADGPTFIPLDGSFFGQVVLRSDGAGSAVRAEISGGSGYVDGDTFELSVIDAGGTVTYTMSRSTTYTVAEVCDTQCSTAMIDL
jgi:hypothetical protein